MRKLIQFTLMLIVCLNCNVDSQTIRGSGRIDQEKRQVGSFTGVNLATFGNLYIELGRKEQLIIEAEDNLLEYFEVFVRGDILIIKIQRGVRLRPKKPVKYYLKVRELNKIISSSSGNIEAPKLEAKRFSVVSSSSGNINIDGLDATSLKANLSSSGNVRIDELRGKTLQINISSSGNLKIEDGKVDEQNATLSVDIETLPKRQAFRPGFLFLSCVDVFLQSCYRERHGSLQSPGRYSSRTCLISFS